MPALETTWTWERAQPLKYVLAEEEWDGEQIVWARCADADGFFVDPAPHRKRLTLVGCAPTGRLLKAAEHARRRPGEPVDLGELGLIVDFSVPRADPETDPYGAYRDDHWELLAPVLTGCGPSGLGTSLFDLVVEAGIDGPGWHDEPADAEWRLFNGPGGGGLGTCHRVEGLYRGVPASPPMRLIGCEPGERLLRRLVRPRGDGDRVTLLAVDRTGRVMRHQEHMPLHVIASRPSRLGGTLLDLWLAGGPAVRPVPAARPVWDAWFEGPPAGPGTWAAFPSEGRSEWAAFAAARQDTARQDTARQDTGRPPADPVRHLDGRHVTDVPGLVCAIGEAVAGPGGHYPQCWHALRGCPCGGDLPPAPFTLVWHDAGVARRALAEVSVDTEGETPYVDDVLRLLARLGITVELR